MSEILVSVVIAVHDGERYLGEALESILAQAHRPLEVIVVDDGSSDGSARVAEAFGEPVRVLRHPHRGLPHPVNAGIEAAGGELLAFLDSDDLWRADKLELQLAVLREQPEIDFCTAQLQSFVSPELGAEAAASVDPELLRPVPSVGTGTSLLRRCALERVGLFNPDFQHAYQSEWFARARATGLTSASLPDVLLYRRLHDANVSQRWATRSQGEHLDLIKTLLDRRRALGESE